MKRQVLTICFLLLLFPIFSSSQLGLNQVEDDQYEPNDSFATATQIPFNQYQIHSLTSGDEDYFTFTLNENSTVEIFTFATWENLQVSLYASNYTLIADDDNSGIDLNPYLQISLENGTYYFMINHENLYSVYEYKVQINKQNYAENEPNNLIENANPVEFNSTFYGSMFINSSNTDTDWLVLNITEAKYYLITIEALEELSVSLHLEDESLVNYFNEVYRNNQRVNYVFSDVLFEGLYYIKLFSYSSMPYSVFYEYIVADDYEANNMKSSASELTFNTTHHATLHYGNTRDVDWWMFNLTEETRVTLRLDTNMTYLEGELTNEFGNYIGYLEWHYGEDSIYFEFSSILDSGTYYLQIYHWEDETGRYKLFYGPMTGDDFEPNDDFANASDISLAFNWDNQIHIDASFHSDTDEDYYVVDTQDATSITVSVNSHNYYDYYPDELEISLYAENQDLIHQEINNNIFVEVDPGIYYIRLVQNTNMAKYGMSVGFISADGYENDNDPEDATRLFIGNSQTHSLHTKDDVDWFVFTIDDERMVRIETWGYYTGDPEMTLFDSALNQIAYNDDDNQYGGLYPAIRRTLESGTYYIKMNPLSFNQPVQEYTINLEVNIPTDNDPTGEITSSRLEIGFSLGYTLTLMILGFVSIQFASVHKRSKNK